MGLIIERIPHKTVAYAFLEVQAATANEFETLRAEALKRAPHYGFAEAAPAVPKKALEAERLRDAQVEGEAGAEVAAEPVDGASPAETSAVAAPPAEQASAPAPTSTEGLSPREIAKLKMAAKKGA